MRRQTFTRISLLLGVALVLGLLVPVFATGSLTGALQLKISGKGLATAGLGTADDPIDLDWTQLFSSGTGANQASNMFHDRRTLTASATENLDLAGVLTNKFGTVLTFTKVKAIGVKAAAANTNDVQFQRGTTNGVPIFMAASDGIQLTPGAFALVTFPNANGVAVTAGTGDILTFTNSAGGTSVTYDIFIWGVD